MRRSKKAISVELLKSCLCFEAVQNMVASAAKPEDIARYIQEDEKELVAFSRPTVVDLVNLYINSLLPVELAKDVIPQTYTNAINRAGAGLNELDELRAMYDIQKERINIDFGTEKQIKKLFKSTGNEVMIAVLTLEKIIKLKQSLGLMEQRQEEFDVNVHLDAMNLKYGRDEIARVISDPEKRHKLLVMAEKMLHNAMSKDQIIELKALTGGSKVVVDK